MGDENNELLAWKNRISKTIRTVLIIIGTVLLIQVVGFTFVALSARDRAADRAADAKALSVRIQNERKHSLVVSCEDTNNNNAKAMAAVMDLGAKVTPAITKIVNAAIPHRADCVAYANSRVKAK